MSKPRLSKLCRHDQDDGPASFPFPLDQAQQSSCDDLGDFVLAGFEAMSRRIEDLARELNCLGYFEEDDRPRAA